MHMLRIAAVVVNINIIIINTIRISNNSTLIQWVSFITVLSTAAVTWCPRKCRLFMWWICCAWYHKKKTLYFHCL